MKTKPTFLVHIPSRACRHLICCAVLIPIIVEAQTFNPPYLSEMPATERVLREIQGSNPVDTAERQMGAFWQLRQIIYDLALSQRRNRNNVTPDEQRLTTAYYNAYHEVRLRSKVSGSRYEVDPEFRHELFKRFFSPPFVAEYAKANAVFAARHEAYLRKGKEEQARAQADVQRIRSAQEPKPWQRELARCIASGRSETQCMTETLGKGMTDLFPVLKKTPRPSGLFMSGVYTGQGGFSVTFYPEGTIVGCKAVNAEGNHAVQVKDNQVQVKLLPPSPALGFESLAKLLPQPPSANRDEWQGQRIAFPLRPDGKMAGSGTIQVTGQVVVGHTTQETTEQKRIQPNEAAGYSNVHRDGLGLYVDAPVTKTVPIYETRTERCSLGILTATGPAPVLGSTSTAFAAVANLAFGGSDPSAGKVPPPGLRMNGQYVGQSGFDIEFHPESAVVGCREAVVARDYAVGIKGNQVLVNIQNGATPIVLEFRPDGTVNGSGPVQVSGRILVGRSANNDPVFQPKTDACNLGILTPAQPAQR